MNFSIKNIPHDFYEIKIVKNYNFDSSKLIPRRLNLKSVNNYFLESLFSKTNPLSKLTLKQFSRQRDESCMSYFGQKNTRIHQNTLTITLF